MIGTNDAPTDIAPSGHMGMEHAAAGTVMGSFSTTDADAGDTHTCSITAGDADNWFTIAGNQLRLLNWQQ